MKEKIKKENKPFVDYNDLPKSPFELVRGKLKKSKRVTNFTRNRN